tara:strand:- start:55220 stop:57880 length:2661 start_codon:yes stop_codon:yes gene_type:complete
MKWRLIFRITKWITIVVVGLMLLISALILVFKDDIKSYALEEANKYLNKRVHIGYIDVGIWETFPDMSLQFDDVLVHSKFDTLQTIDTAFYSKKMTLLFSPMDFLESNYNIDQIDIENGVLNLKVMEDGRVNYDFLKESDSSSSSTFSFELEKINVRDTRFTYVNEATQQDYRAYFNSVSFGGSFDQDRFTMHSSTDFEIESIRNKALTLITDKHASCDIAIAMDQVNHVFQIEEADLKINKLPFHIEGKVTSDSLDFSIASKDLDLVEVTKNFSLSQLDMVNSLNGSGTVGFDLKIAGPLETTKQPAIDAEFSISNGSLMDNGFTLSDIAVIGEYSNGIKTGKELLFMPKVQFTTMNRKFNGNVKVIDFERPRFIGSADGIINLKALHRLFGPFDLKQLSGNVLLDGKFDVRMNTPQMVLSELEIYKLESSLKMENIIAQYIGDERIFKVPGGELTIRNQKAGFTDVQVEVGGSDIVVDGTFNNVASYFRNEGQLYVDASISSDQLKLEDLSTQGEKESYRNWLLPSSITGKLNLSLNNVKYSEHSYSDIKTQMRFGEHLLRFPYLKGKSAGATVRGDLVIEENTPMIVEVKTNLSSSNVEFAPLFKEWNNFDQTVIAAENIKGKAAIDLSFQGPFDLYKNDYDKKDFKADVRIKISDGELNNVSSMKLITESLRESAAKLLLSKNTINQFEKKLLNLEFETFENRLTINNGIITIPKMTIRSNAMDVAIDGTHTFANEVDYSFSFRFREIKGAKTSEFGDIVDDGTGVKIYLKMTGTVDEPIFSWDKEAMKKEKEEQREEAKEDFKSALKTGFGINKNDTTINDLKEEEHREEKLIMEFDKDSIEQEFLDSEKKKKKSALQKRIEKWKKENKEGEKKETFEISD